MVAHPRWEEGRRDEGYNELTKVADKNMQCGRYLHFWIWDRDGTIFIQKSLSYGR